MLTKATVNPRKELKDQKHSIIIDSTAKLWKALAEMKIFKESSKEDYFLKDNAHNWQSINFLI